MQFQTHQTPVRVGAGERAELGTNEYFPYSSVLEGLVILKKWVLLGTDWGRMLTVIQQKRGLRCRRSMRPYTMIHSLTTMHMSIHLRLDEGSNRWQGQQLWVAESTPHGATVDLSLCFFPLPISTHVVCDSLKKKKSGGRHGKSLQPFPPGK